MQWNFYKNFIPLTDKIEAGADLVRTITSLVTTLACFACLCLFDIKQERRTQSSVHSIVLILLCEHTTRLIETTKCQYLAVIFTEYKWNVG